MTPEAQQIAIAEVCGYEKKQSHATFGHDEPRWLVKDVGVWLPAEKLPDYPNDLNAMHEAQKVLTPDQRDEMIKLIYDMRNLPLDQSHADFDATAAQRAEAFLRTLGLWKNI